MYKILYLKLYPKNIFETAIMALMIICEKKTVLQLQYIQSDHLILNY